MVQSSHYYFPTLQNRPVLLSSRQDGRINRTSTVERIQNNDCFQDRKKSVLPHEIYV